MADLLKYWAARKRSDVDPAAGRLLYAKAQLRAAEAAAKPAKRRASRGRAQAARS
jgi:hypothetical protein